VRGTIKRGGQKTNVVVKITRKRTGGAGSRNRLKALPKSRGNKKKNWGVKVQRHRRRDRGNKGHRRKGCDAPPAERIEMELEVPGNRTPARENAARNLREPRTKIVSDGKKGKRKP